MKVERAASGAPYEASVGYCRAVRAGDRIFVSGTAPIGDDGQNIAPGDPEAQTRRCIEVIASALESLGAGLGDIVRTRLYITHREDWQAVTRVHGEHFGDIRPACTLIVVAGLLDPEWRVEIEAEAIVGVAPQ